MNYAILMGDDSALARTKSLSTLFVRLGFVPCANMAAVPALGKVLMLQWVPHMFSAASTFDQIKMPVGSVRFAVIPADAPASVRVTLAERFDAVLTEPIDEIGLCNALAAQRFDALAPAECHALRTKVLELAGDDAATARHLLQLIVSVNRATLTLLCDSVEAASWDEAGSAAHRITGSARMLDCSGLIALLTRLEAAAREREVELAKALLPLVVNALESLDVSVQKALGPDGRF